MTITINTAPVDDHGLLMHADDAVAQACLAVVRLESRLSELGLPGSAIVAIRVLTNPPANATDLSEVVAEELDRLGVSAAIHIEDAASFEAPGQLVGLRADVTPKPSNQTNEGGTMHHTPDLTELSQLTCVLTPRDVGYLEACLTWNRAARIRPAAVAVPESVEELVQVVRASVAARLRIAPQSTGHNATALADVDFEDVVLVRLSAITGVSVDPEARTARVLGGTLWEDVIEAAAPHGLTALHGSARDVAVAGYVLGGGLSFYGRKHGLASEFVRAFEVVTAQGELVRASAEENADLFWALRGGGGNFGIVVEIELDLLPIADVVAGMMMWDIEHAPEVLRAWAAWTESAPESATTNFRIFRFPPIPDLPPFLSGRNLAIIDGAILEDDAEADRILRPLRDLAPEMDTFGRIPAAGLLDVHMDPPQPTPAVSDHSMLKALPEDAIEAFLAVAGPGADTSLFFAELRHLGGEFRREHGGALTRIDEEFALFAISIAPTPAAQQVGDTVTRGVIEAMRPWSTGGRYSNFSDRPGDASTMFGSDEWKRLERVRESCDPDGVWVAAHSIGSRPITPTVH